jgi:crotonyl-CoA reductase
VHLELLIPPLSKTYPLSEVGEATRSVQLNRHVGKVGIRCLAPADGTGIQALELRERYAERALRLFREF